MMNIEIWSDKVCPFCYIGKRKFEAALAKFEHRDQVRVTWKSFQLDPTSRFEAGKTIYQSLAEKKGMSVAQARQMTTQVSAAAREIGLDFDFDRIQPANTIDAHRLTHLASAKGLQNESEEALFKAYFIDGKNIEDRAVLSDIGIQLGLDKAEIESAFESEELLQEVLDDITEATQLGITGVPFFVFNRQYAVSGAQSPDGFLGALQQAWNQTEKVV